MPASSRHAWEVQMAALRFEVERIDVVSRKSFPEVVAALEAEVPAADIAVFVRLSTARASAPEIEKVVAGMVGDLGFLTLVKLDQGPLVSLLGRPKKMSVYLIGNPVLANRMYERDPGVSLYAPLRASLYEDYQGRCHFTYERPSRVVEQFDNEGIRATARILDERMESLADRLAQ